MELGTTLAGLEQLDESGAQTESFL